MPEAPGDVTRAAPIGYNPATVAMRSGFTALLLGGVLGAAGCERASTVTLQLGEPLRSDAGAAPAGDAPPPRCRDNVDTTGDQLLAEFYRDTGRERCVALSVVADRGDVPTRFYAVRTRRIVPSSLSVTQCLGPRGATIVEGLPDTAYTLRLMVLDLDDLDVATAVPIASQNLTRDAAGAWPESLCLPWFSCSPIDFSRAAVAEALAACARAGAAPLPSCSLGPTGGTTCPMPQP